MMGTLPVADGLITGRRVSWSVTVTFGGQTMLIGYAGEIDGTRMTGTVASSASGQCGMSLRAVRTSS
jgi:hypothetical protein